MQLKQSKSGGYMLKATIDVKISMQLQSFNIQLMPPCWGSQQILSTPPQPMWGTNNILMQGHTNIHRQVDTMTEE